MTGAIGDFQGSDPTAYILGGLNEIMLRSGIVVATEHDNTVQDLDPGVDVVQRDVNATITSTISVFEAQYRWWGAAAIVQCSCILVILPLFWGWWKLTRQTTLSPFEVAQAMEAPLLRDVHSNAGAKGVVREAGGMRLRYGQVALEGIDGGWKEGMNGPRSYLALRQENDVSGLRGK